MTSVVCIGEIASDLIVYTESAAIGSERSFQRLNASPEEWLEQLAEYTADHRFVVHGGGSIANVVAALVSVLPRPHQVSFSVAEQPRLSRLAPPLWWVGVEPSRRDLMHLAVGVRGGTPAPVLPTSPGAVAFVNRSGTVSRLVAVQQEVCDIREVPGDWLVVRSDHLVRLAREYVATFDCVAVLLADDGAGWPEVESLARMGRLVWLFGGRRYAGSFVHDVADSRVGAALTDGAHDCEVTWPTSGERWSLPVERVTVAGTDLGAGDAYMGGFLGSLLSGGDALTAHHAGVGAAKSALAAQGARAPVPTDLTTVFPDIQRAGSGMSEGLLLDDILTSPGVTLVSGGQTGVDSLVGTAAASVGLPVHYVFPAGFRTERGRLAASDRHHLGRLRCHQLDAESFRYRTWATVYFSDAALVLNYAAGEGTAEALRAARYFNKPVLDLTDEPLAAPEVASWLLERDSRIAMIAGSRDSLLTSSTRDRALFQAREIALALCEVNRAFLGHRAFPDLRVGNIGVPRRVLDSPLGTHLLANGLDESRIVSLEPRDLAAAFEHGRLPAVITWPSLLAPTFERPHTVEPFGAFSIHYGLVVGSRAAVLTSIADQYPEAFDGVLGGTRLAEMERISIRGGAETWLAQGFVDAAYDTYRTGATLSAHELGPFYPSHWETLALLKRC